MFKRNLLQFLRREEGRLHREKERQAVWGNHLTAHIFNTEMTVYERIADLVQSGSFDAVQEGFNKVVIKHEGTLMVREVTHLNGTRCIGTSPYSELNKDGTVSRFGVDYTWEPLREEK